jgi:uncharacterized protein YegL
LFANAAAMVAVMKLAFVGGMLSPAVSLTVQKASAGLETETAASEELSAGVENLLRMDSSSPSVAHLVNAGMQHMSVRQAAQKVRQQHLPAEVASLVDTAAGSQNGQQPTFSEESMAKARRVLNEMVEKAWEELDDKIIQCKEFEEQNRGTYDQVNTDISRLIEQITDLERIEAESLHGIFTKEKEILDVEKELERETQEYKKTRAENDAEMRIRQNDLDVFTFILQFTQCEGATSLMQQKTRVCENNDGYTLHLGDDKAQSKFEHILTSTSRRALSNLLSDLQAQHPLSFLQNKDDEEPESAPEVTPPPAQDAVPVAGQDIPSFDAHKVCKKGVIDCGLLHDKLSLLWGDYKDKVDELQMEMNENEYEFEELKMNLNEQISILVTSKGRFSMQLAEARSNLAADRSEKKEKEDQRVELDRAFHEFMERCKKRITWITQQDMCAIIVVRNAVLETSQTCNPAQFKDCDVDSWIPAQCSVSCDDDCPNENDPYACGGWQTISRKVVVAPTPECGLRCPSLSRQKKCNQIKCPVNCEMSEWSGWSKCTAECEGGVQAHTRSILTLPSNGGESCNTIEESRACNTESCDRDCTLAPWTAWTPCSVACGGGFQERYKHVLIPIRGGGKCPKAEGSERYAKQECNAHSCVGDEICIANQDLLLAIDGSGSLTEDGFGKLKNFATAIISKYQGEYYGKGAMQVGVIEFGNGVIMEDGTVSAAVNVQPLTTDMGAVKTALEGLPYKKGFTNMAQAFALAEKMYTTGGREGAQSAIMVITDGKPSFQFQTNEFVRQLDDKGVQRFFVVVKEGEDELDQMKNWASVPWDTNLIHVPGLALLEADQNIFAQKALTMFCPLSFSPSVKGVQEVSQGFMHIKDGGFCGGRGRLLSRDVTNDAQCAYLAQGANAQAFFLGTWFRSGWCYAGRMEVSEEQYNTWRQNRVNPECPSGWRNSRIWDFYAIEPVSSGESSD